MPPTPLPGFHYDTTKRKYFKIQPNHIAPTNSSYSTSSVKKAAEDSITQKTLKAYEQRKSLTRIARSKLLSYGVCRESGLGLRGEGMVEQWAGGLEPTSITDAPASVFVYDDSIDVFAFAHQRDGVEKDRLFFLVPREGRERGRGRKDGMEVGPPLDSQVCGAFY